MMDDNSRHEIQIDSERCFPELSSNCALLLGKKEASGARGLESKTA